MTAEPLRYAYIGKLRACGCTVAVVVDEPGYEKGTAKDVADFIKRGYLVERMDLEQARVLVGRCIHEARQGKLA